MTVPMCLRIPPLKFKIMLESNPLKSTMLVRRLAVPGPAFQEVRSSGLVPAAPGDRARQPRRTTHFRKTNLSLSLYIYIYIHTYIHTHTYIHIYVYIYIYIYIHTYIHTHNSLYNQHEISKSHLIQSANPQLN